MSLINRVLNQLEQRGAHTAPSQTQIRAVPEQADRYWLKPILAVATISVVAVAGWWLWPKTQQPLVAPVKLATEVVTVSAVSDVLPAEPDLPASKLSLELSAVPVPELPQETQDVQPARPNPERSAIATQPSKPKPAERKPMETKTVENKPVASKPPVVEAAPVVELPLKQISRTQQADAEYRKALVSRQQGHEVEALAGYEAALKLNPQHEAARLAQAALLMENKRSAEAERTLQEGLRLQPSHSGFSMALARVQVERGNVQQALGTLQQNLPQADDKAAYQAFYAALLQREGRHKEAVNHFEVAVKLAPNSGVWLMGYGISLQALKRIEDARDAYQHALATQTLSPELTAFVQQKLKGF